MVAFCPRNVTLEMKPFCKGRAAQTSSAFSKVPWQVNSDRKLSQPLVGETQTLSRLGLIVLSVRFRPGFDWDSSLLFCSIWLMLPTLLQTLSWVSPSQLNPARPEPDRNTEKCSRDGATLVYLQDSQEISFILGWFFCFFFLNSWGFFFL